MYAMPSSDDPKRLNVAVTRSSLGLNELPGLNLATPTVRLASDAVIVTVQVRPVSGISATDWCGARRTGFRAVGESTGARGRSARRYADRITGFAGRSIGTVLRRSARPAVTMIVPAFPIIVAPLLVEATAMRPGAPGRAEEDECNDY